MLIIRRLILYHILLYIQIFKRPIPVSSASDVSTTYDFKMVNGVMAVTQINMKNGHNSNNAYNTTPTDSNNTAIDNNDNNTNNNNNNDNNSDSSTVVFSVPSFNEFITDFNIIRKCVYSGPVTSYRLVHIRVFSA